MLTRRTLIKSTLLATAGALGFRRARAAYPDHPVRLIVPFVPGGAVDAVGRLLGNAMTASLGAPVVIENRGGAGGIIGMEASAHAVPDGYTMMVSHAGFAAMPGFYRKLAFDPVADFAGIITAVSGIYVLVVNPNVPFDSVAGLIAYAKANPGKLSFASAGVGSTVHLAGEFFKHAAGIDIVHVPYKGSGPATTDLVAGQVQMMFGPAVNTLPLAQAGKLRALAVTSGKRSALAPDLPTIAESGIPGFDVVGWYGLAAPVATPAAAIAKLNAAANSALKQPQLIEEFRVQGYEPVGGTPEEATQWIKAEVARWTKVIRDAGIEPQ
ncbi:MAG TPA: tripartite tricarboxylate transporter substrate binding protein [Xanthobacteraceae bacterium]|nr:tripartite tricarboxylate transporter substrate binding protein [Xanthobacteraceae bacterium]